MKTILRYLLICTTLVGLSTPLAQPALAQDRTEYGYLWSLFFDFEKSFDGLLTIEVGPWKNGDLVEVHESSTVTIPCKRAGNVQLNGGAAIFAGNGYLVCSMNLKELVRNNHGLLIESVDNYGSILFHAEVMGEANTIAPIFTHQDAAYSLDFTQTSQTTLLQSLWNGVGPMPATIPGPTLFTWEAYTQEYRCTIAGACSAKFAIGPQQQNQPIPGGTRTQFTTEPATFEIGHAGGTFFTGRMASLLIDPGNSAH
jgi:hypothetical protein